MTLLEKHLADIPNPCYVIEEDLLRRNLALIKNVSERAGVEIILAFKAFALWKAFPIFREYICHTTASSPYEARLAFEEFGSKAHTYSPAYEDETFDEILRCSSHVTFNSLSQLERFASRAHAGGVSVGLRVNPGYSEIETELYNPCAPGSRFGVLHPMSLDGIDGFHVHNHCESSAEAFVRSLKHVEEKFGYCLPQLKWMNFGGGHLLTRRDYNVDLLVQTLQDFRRRYPNLHVILEPGSAFAWQTGPLVSRVVDIVVNNGVRTAILNVSFTCHMPDCLEMPYQPAIRHATMGCMGEHCYRIGGNSCLSGDVMGDWTFDHELQVGETIIFEDMIHYTTVKTTMFNGIHHPSIGMLHSDGRFELYRQFSYEDYRDRMC